MVGPAAKREAVAHLRNVLQMSERRALQPRCRRSQDDPLSLTPPPDVELRTRLRDLANHRRRFATGPRRSMTGYCWSLRARRERPRRRRAGKQRDELAPLHVWMAPAWQEIIWRAA